MSSIRQTVSSCAAALWLAASVCSVGALCGCASDGAALKPRSDARFPDVVVPAGFKLVRSRVAASQSHGHRDGIRCYQGRLGAPALLDFIRMQYGIGHWTLEYSQTLGTRTFLDYRKRSERCSILVEEQWRSTLVTIRVYEISE